MAETLAEIRARLKAQAEREESIKNGTFTGERTADSFLAFWNINDNQPLNLRFLPDADPNNPYFWRERDMIKLTFNGIVGASNDVVTVQVPCNEMWVPKGCPILAELRKWYADAKETGNEELAAAASKYWKKKSYLMQCFIAPDSTEVKNDMAPENPIRRVLVNKEIFAKVKSILLNPGIKELPTHYEHGRDFSVVKSKNGGGFNNYDMSQFSMSERELNEAEREAIDKYGIFDLNDFMPKQPTAEELQAISEMFEASVNGEAYDPARWSQFYRPAGVQKPSAGSTLQSTKTHMVDVGSLPPQKAIEVVQEAQAKVQESTQATASTSAADLVAQLKARKNA